YQTLDVLFDHVVRRASFEGIDREMLGQRACEENERNVWQPLSRELERFHAVERGESEVGQDDPEATAIELGQEIGAGRNHRDLTIRPRFAQQIVGQPGILSTVLEMENFHCATSGGYRGASRYSRRVGWFED